MTYECPTDTYQRPRYFVFEVGDDDSHWHPDSYATYFSACQAVDSYHRVGNVDLREDVTTFIGQISSVTVIKALTKEEAIRVLVRAKPAWEWMFI